VGIIRSEAVARVAVVGGVTVRGGGIVITASGAVGGGGRSTGVSPFCAYAAEQERMSRSDGNNIFALKRFDNIGIVFQSGRIIAISNSFQEVTLG
jgi:hypothetical protein